MRIAILLIDALAFFDNALDSYFAFLPGLLIASHGLRALSDTRRLLCSFTASVGIVGQDSEYLSGVPSIELIPKLPNGLLGWLIWGWFIAGRSAA